MAFTSQGAMNAGLLTRIASLPDVDAACATTNPYLVTTCFRGMLRSERDTDFSPKAPSVLMFNETSNDLPHYQLADFSQVGSVFGLAYSHREHAVYAGAYQKRQLPFGKDGPGAIYRISLTDGSVTTFAKLNAGPDLHPRLKISDSLDELTRDLVSKSGLGDLDIDEDDRHLFVTNLFDRRIYVFELSTGTQLSSIEHGASNEPWAADARPFGLEVHRSLLYHVVMNTAENSRDRRQLSFHVYQSAFDGSNMRLVGRIQLNRPRGEIHIGPIPTKANVDWRPWKDDYPRGHPGNFLYNVFPMPIATDLEIDGAGNLVVSLRDRLNDLSLLRTRNTPYAVGEESLALGVGDIEYGVWNGAAGMFDFDVDATRYVDKLTFIGDHSALGGLAYVNLDLSVGRFTQMAAGALGTQQKLSWIENPREGVIYYDVDGRQIPDTYDNGLLREEVCAAEVSIRAAAATLPQLLAPSVAFAHNGEIPLPPPTPTPGGIGTPAPITVRGPGTIGDLEVLCKRSDVIVPTPTASSTATPSATTSATLSATPTATSSATATSTLVATPTPDHVFLPLGRSD